MSLFDEIKVLMKNVSEKIKKPKDTNSENNVDLDFEDRYPLDPKLIRERAAYRNFHAKAVKNNTFDYDSLLQKYTGEEFSKTDNSLAFDSIHIDTVINLEININIGSEDSFEIPGDKQLTEDIGLEVKNNTLYIKNVKFSPTKPQVTVNITMTNLRDLHINGRVSCNITDLYSESLSIFIPGSAELKMSGITKSMNLDLTGKSNIYAKDLLCDKAMVNILGSSTVVLTVDRELEAIVDGNGKLDYYGNPQKVIRNINSIGKINNLTDLKLKKQFINLELYPGEKAEKSQLKPANASDIMAYIDKVAGINRTDEGILVQNSVIVLPEDDVTPDFPDYDLSEPELVSPETSEADEHQPITTETEEVVFTSEPLFAENEELIISEPFFEEKEEPVNTELIPEEHVTETPVEKVEILNPETTHDEQVSEKIFSEPELVEPASLDYSEETDSISPEPVNEYGLGADNRQRLNLAEAEAKLLNEVLYTRTSFTSIRQCLDETIKLYLFLVKETEKFLGLTKSGIEARSKKLAKRSKRESYYYDSYYWKSKILTDIFKLAEGVIRDNYGHSKKTDSSFYTEKLKDSLNSPMIENLLEEKINEYLPFISYPSIETQTDLNELNPSSWKNKFKEVERNISQENITQTVENLEILYKVNTRNPHLSQIYFSSSKTLLKYTKKESLKAYVNYYYLSFKQKAEIKKLTSTAKKVYFKDENQYEKFIEIMERLEKYEDIELALFETDELLTVKKKKITLDISAISDVKELHSETLEKLNEVLKEEEPETILQPTPVKEKPELNLQVIFSTSKTESDELISLKTVQKKFISLLINSTSLADEQVAEFAKTNNIFKSQLINGINELSIEAFDDNLIEENEEGFIINSDYINRVRI